MGEATGMSTVHVNRMLKALRDANLVQVDGSEIAVQDWQALTEFAEFDSGYLSHERPQRLLAKT